MESDIEKIHFYAHWFIWGYLFPFINIVCRAVVVAVLWPDIVKLTTSEFSQYVIMLSGLIWICEPIFQEHKEKPFDPEA